MSTQHLQDPESYLSWAVQICTCTVLKERKKDSFVAVKLLQMLNHSGPRKKSMFLFRSMSFPEHRCTAGLPRASSAGDPSTGQDAGLVSTLLPAHRLSAVPCLTAQPSFPQHNDRGPQHQPGCGARLHTTPCSQAEHSALSHCPAFLPTARRPRTERQPSRYSPAFLPTAR